MNDIKNKHTSTRLIHAGENELAKSIQKEVSVPKVLPIYMSSVFSFDTVEDLDAVYDGTATGNVYSRMSNPSTQAVEEILAASEQCDGALVFSSGMAAITTSILANVQSGDHIISSPVLYGGVYDYFKNELPRFGITVTFVDFEDVEALRKAIQPNTKIIYTETISNPLMEVINIPEIAKIAHEFNCKLIVDNTFATSVICKPITLGADIVVYSTTKYLGGHSDILGGAIVSDKENIAHLKRYSTLYGSIMSPFDAWLLARSLRTLDLRMKQHSKNALKVAQYLSQHPKIEKVYYPGLEDSKYHALSQDLFTDGLCGGMLSADIIHGEKGASTFIEHCKMIKLVPSLAGVSTTISYPAKTSHRAYSEEDMRNAGISMGQLRFSIGLEEVDDIIEELEIALSYVE